MSKSYTLRGPDRVADLLYAVRNLEEIQRELIWEIRNIIDQIDQTTQEEPTFAPLLR